MAEFLPIESIAVPENSHEQLLEQALVHHQAGQFREAQSLYEKILTIDPDDLNTWNNLGTALKAQGQLDRAIAAYQQALAIEPDVPEVHHNLGNTLRAKGEIAAAILEFRQTIQLRPDFLPSLQSLAEALRTQGDYEEAITLFRQALALHPDDPISQTGLANTLFSSGRINDAITAYRAALATRPQNAASHSNLLFALHFHPDLKSIDIFQEHLDWNRQHAQPLAGEIHPHQNDPNPHRRLRIGYVSPDFRHHSVASFLENLLPFHDPKQVEVFCYSDVSNPDAITERFKKSAHHWKNIVGASDAAVTETIRQDAIDILIDLSGHTSGNHLLIFARKPAPISVTYLGYPDTTGMKTIDYRFTDAVADPPGSAESLHSEKLIRLPGTFACYKPLQNAPDVAPLPALKNGYVTFAGFTSLHKLNEPLLNHWASILSQTPNSRLILAANGLHNPSTQQPIREIFARHGISTDRLEIHGHLPTGDYLTLHSRVDLLLDTFPANGHTVTCHALWMGVPPVTLAGQTHIQRLGATVLKALSLPDLIAQTPEEYIRIALDRAVDLPHLSEVRGSLRARMIQSPLMDAQRLARNVESAYREMWKRWCQKDDRL